MQCRGLTATAGQHAVAAVSPRVAASRTRPSRASPSVVCHAQSAGNESSTEIGRRAALAGVAALVAAPSIPPPACADGAWREFSDPLLAYGFRFPTATPSGKSIAPALSRKPERYSSAAPLTADARQRIVVEFIDLKDAYTVSVSVGPASPALKEVPEAEWTPKQIANAVLVDKSTARVTSGQRVSLAKLESVAAKTMEDGTRYVMYEHVSQGTPTQQLGPGKEAYRHAWSSTAIRPGSDGSPYLYTFNISCPEELYTEIKESMEEAAGTFRLLPTTRGYVAPDRDPWRFF